jgi:hypothetical protein
MTTIATDSLMTGTTTELTAHSANWAYAKTNPNSTPAGTGIQVGVNGASSNATGTSYSQGGVAYWTGGTFPADQWAQVVAGPIPTNISAGMALILRALPANGGSWLAFEIRWNGGALLWGSSAGGTVSAPVSGTSSLLGQTWAQGDVFRMELHGSTISLLRAPAATPGSFTTLFTPGAWNATGNAILALGGGRPGIGAFQGSGTLNYIQNFTAGDFVTGPLPPTPPTGPQGAFTVRTT